MSQLAFTPIDEISKIHERARAAFRSGKTKSIAFRKEQIAQVGYMLKDHEERFKKAVQDDIGRHFLETEFIDLPGTYIDIKTAYDNCEKWSATRNGDFSLGFWAMGPKVRIEPKGVVLIIAPFNGPIIMLLSPLVGAIAAGNAAILKPSEQVYATAALFAELVPQYLDNELYHVVNGGIPETTKLLEFPFDHIMYTGSGRVARIIATAAAKHLTPLTLELGGKNPVVLDAKSDLKLAAKRILWGRFINAGQMCVCPEYVLVPRDVQDKFIEEAEEVYATFYPDGPRNSPSFSRIVAEHHAARIKGLLDNTRGTIILGGETDVAEKYIAPTVVKDVSVDDSLMNEEIFGPILPLISVNDVDEAIEFINARDHALVVYVFSQDKAFQEKVFSNTQSGTAVANDCVLIPGVSGIPMGGVGASGYGYYTGKDMFEQFSHKRASIDNPGWVDRLGLGCRYPPYVSLKPMQALLPALPPRPRPRGEENVNMNTSGTAKWPVGVAAAGAAVTLLACMISGS